MNMRGEMVSDIKNGAMMRRLAKKYSGLSEFQKAALKYALHSMKN